MITTAKKPNKRLFNSKLIEGMVSVPRLKIEFYVRCSCFEANSNFEYLN